MCKTATHPGSLGIGLDWVTGLGSFFFFSVQSCSSRRGKQKERETSGEASGEQVGREVGRQVGRDKWGEKLWQRETSRETNRDKVGVTAVNPIGLFSFLRGNALSLTSQFDVAAQTWSPGVGNL